LAAGLAIASITGFNIMSGDQELLRLKNQTQGTVNWQDPISANAGDQIRLMAYYHCGTDDPAWSTIRANNVRVRLEFPTVAQSGIVTTARIFSNNLSTVSDAGTINVSTAQKLTIANAATWYHDGIETSIAATVGSGYVEVNLGNLECDYMNCFTKTGFIIFNGTLSAILPPTVDIKANGSDGPVSIAYNQAATLTWASTNATSCVASGDWSGAKSVSGSESTGNLTSNKSYTITCTGTGGTANDSVTVNVQTAPPTVDLKANSSDGPITINYNTSALLSWTTTNNPTTCTAGSDWSGTKSVLSGSESTGLLTITKTYSLTCSNTAGSASDSVLVQVLYCLPAPPSLPF
ncbi:MAG: hypothetical protein Q8N56_02850, partial [bacterium]|nr:hypothetical protein [bacterium]